MFEFVVAGIPRTIQTKNPSSRESWKNRVAEEALAVLETQRHYFATSCTATVVYFYSESTELDVDGIAKLILDGLKRIVYEDDNIVDQVTTRKSDQVGLAVSNPPAVLAAALGTFPNLVYVRIENGPNHSELPK